MKKKEEDPMARTEDRGAREEGGVERKEGKRSDVSRSTWVVEEGN